MARGKIILVNRGEVKPRPDNVVYESVQHTVLYNTKFYTQFEIQLQIATVSPSQGQISSKQVQIEAEHPLFLLIFIIAEKYTNLSSSKPVNIAV